MKKMRKIINGILLSVFLFLGIGAYYKTEKVYAADASISITANPGQIMTGDAVTISIKLHCATGITYTSFQLIYDANVLDYVSGDADGSGFSGVIPFEIMGGAEEKNDYSWNLQFKAKQTGNCNFSVKVIKFLDTDMNEFTPNCGTASVTVMAPGSDDATLSSITIAGANLNPAFAKWTMDYVCYVANGVTSVNISAVATQGGRIEIAGNYTNLNVGSNNITITSYAPNGKAMTYKVNIYRLEPPTEPPSTEPPTEVPSDADIVVNGNNMTVSSSFSAEDIPEGFELDLFEYDGKEVFCVKNEELKLTLLNLKDKDGNGGFYVYDNKEFYEYKYIGFADNTYYIFDSRKADKKPEGNETEFTIGETTLKGFVDAEDSDFVYFYAMNSKGEYGWYIFDKKENTIQRKMNTSSMNFEKETETESETQTSEEDTTAGEKKGEKNTDIVKLILFVAIGVAVLIIIIMVIVIVSKKKKASTCEIEFDAEEPEIPADEAAVTVVKPDVIEEIMMDDSKDSPEETKENND